MSISRRDALRGATAAAVITGAITAPLAIKAAGAKAALGGEPLVALEAELIQTRAAGAKAHALWEAAYDKAGDWPSVGRALISQPRLWRRCAFGSNATPG